MGKHFKPDIKLEVITKYFNNEASLNMLSKEYNIPRSTIFKLKNIIYQGQQYLNGLSSLEMVKTKKKKKKDQVELKKKILIIKNDTKY